MKPGKAWLAIWSLGLGLGFQGVPALGATPDSGGLGVDENALFADSASVSDSSRTVDNAASTASVADKKTLSVSGSLLIDASASVNRDYLDQPDARGSSWSAGAIGDANLDARLLRGFRAFSTLEWSGDTARFRVPELFLDANVERKVYFRVGKQVLQWGRCYFFNPTDLINVERKSFFRRLGAREGVLGAKAHAPFGTRANLYGFVDAQDVHRPDSLAGAAKAEFTLGGTEASAMIWDRAGGPPVYGADVSTRWLGLDLNGEAALHQDFRSLRVTETGGLPSISERYRPWLWRAAGGLGRSFRVSGIQDRLTTVAEFYFNQPGTAAGKMPFADIVKSLGSANPSQSGALKSQALTAALAAAMAGGVYEPNSYSRRYAALFATFNRFLRSDLTLTGSAVANLDQECALFSAGVAYQDINDFSLSFYVNGFSGPEGTEYTFLGQAVQAQFVAEASF